MKTDKDIESLLALGSENSLLTEEKALIKIALLEHATHTLAKGLTPIRSPWVTWVIRGSTSLVAFFIACIGTAYTAQNSLPGEPLYAVKVHVVENAIAHTKFDPIDQSLYVIERMEIRLEELQLLADQVDLPSSDSIDAITEQINEHIADVTETVQSASESVMSKEEKVNVVAKLHGITKAQADTARNEKDLSLLFAVTRDSEDTTSDLLANTVGDFTEGRSTTTVNNYLSKHITAVGEQIQASSTDDDTRDAARQFLEDVNDSLTEGNVNNALIFVLEAQEEIHAGQYLDENRADSEVTE